MPTFTDIADILPSTLDALPRALTAAPPLTAVEEASLALANAAGEEPGASRADVERGREARSRLILANVRLVVSVARRYEGRGVSLVDLVQEGVVGLIAAVDRFDAARGVRFSSYAVPFIRRHVADAVSTRRTVRIPPKVEHQLVVCRQVADGLLHEYGRPPSAAAIAHRIGLAPGFVTRLLAADAPALTLDAVHDLEEPTSPEEAADRAQGVRALVDLLPSDEREVVELRFGLDGLGVRTVKAVGESLGRSDRWVQRVERRALTRLRNHPALSSLVA